MVWTLIGNIRGPSGAAGSEGVGISSINDLGGGEVEVVLTDGRTFTFQAPAGPVGVGGVPIGAIVMWSGDQFGMSIPDGFVFCNGGFVSDPASPINGAAIPDFNVARRFARGNTASGGVGGSDTHNHLATTPEGSARTDGGEQASFLRNPGEAFITASGSSLPSYGDVIFIMRVR